MKLKIKMSSRTALNENLNRIKRYIRISALNNGKCLLLQGSSWISGFSPF